VRTVIEGVLQPQAVGCFVHFLQKKHDFDVVAGLGVLDHIWRLLYLSAGEVVLLSFLGELFFFFLLEGLLGLTAVLLLVLRRVCCLASA